MIVFHNYEVGGVDYSSLQNIPQVLYKYEMGESYSGYTENMKIGLMYISDYVFASPPEDWSLRVNNYDIDIDRNNNWLFLYPNPSYRNNCEWFLSKANDSTEGALCIYSSNNSTVGGDVYYYWVVNARHYIRPVFYLSSSVAYASGSGTQLDPIRLKV